MFHLNPIMHSAIFALCIIALCVCILVLLKLYDIVKIVFDIVSLNEKNFCDTLDAVPKILKNAEVISSKTSKLIPDKDKLADGAVFSMLGGSFKVFEFLKERILKK